MDAAADPSTHELAGRLRADGVKYMFASYVDLHGVSKGKVVPIDHLGRMMKGSELSDINTCETELAA
jgi:glutamine synthetase